jgi:hypothetical protein
VRLPFKTYETIDQRAISLIDSHATHLVVVLDLEDEMLDDVNCHLTLAIHQETETTEVGIPVVELKSLIMINDPKD